MQQICILMILIGAPKLIQNLFLEIKSIFDDEEEEEVKRIDSFSIPLEQIKAIGWEYDEPTPRLPTIVGS
ncbi:hypothetical protein Godav_029221 [Gossypium davidsonii]|uniref:Uncharacterized protein n=1 Tax=Gossypium davidsonii TaxID=34287 RepID=A0A7J8TB15_GOSDV|nr:hypothetical protein [Gossypium davidsonii]